MRNESLFREIADTIEIEPRAYRQASWFGLAGADPADGWCGTTGCIAGWAVALARFNGDATSAFLHYFDGIAYTCERDGLSVEDDARGLLGLNEQEAFLLFDESWCPHEGLSVPDALRKIAEGAEIEDVSDEGAQFL